MHVASLFNLKAKKWVQGRKDIFEKLGQAIPPTDKVIWMHCASLGEFEQGRPVIEKLRKNGTGHKILLTFFSPSGYEVQKDYKGADWVFYLPIDGPRNAKRFLELVHPSMVIIVKYDFWFYYLKKASYRNIPLLLIAASFRKDMFYFKWYGKLHRKMLSRFDCLFVQDKESKELIDAIGLSDTCFVSGDTRFDRVIEIASADETIPVIEKFIGNDKVIIAGSTWENDEDLLCKTQDFLIAGGLKLIIAPHEISEKHLNTVKKLFPQAILFSELSTSILSQSKDPLATCLIIDNIGMLSVLYKYAYCSYVGGGLSRTGVHNVLEAAVYGKPVLYGPNYEKYREAVELVAVKGGCIVSNKDEFTALLDQFMRQPGYYQETAEKAGNYVRENAGAVKIITGYIQEKRLLTS